MAIILTIKINNQDVLEDSIRIINHYPTISWDFDKLNSVIIGEPDGVIDDINIIQQKSFEIRIGTSLINCGSDGFFGEISQTGVVNSVNEFWRFEGETLIRGWSYYGQIKVIDNLNRQSVWYPFSFIFNSLPEITSAQISPTNPTINNNLVLSYTYYDSDGDLESNTKINWFKNGEYQRQLDDLINIGFNLLQNGDIWSADLIPFDGYELGSKFSVIPVKVVEMTDEDILANDTLYNVIVKPDYANENDILKADYQTTVVLDENPEIRWFINGQVMSDFDNQKFVRLDIQPGDIVKYDIRLQNTNVFVSSEPITILSSNFIIADLKIDGESNPLSVITIRPIITWINYTPFNRTVRYIKIKVGTFFGGDNVYSEIIATNHSSFRFPANILEKGRDYFVSVAASDSNSSFNNFSYARFRIVGSRWELDVNNSVGWTFETAFSIENIESFDETKFQSIIIQDGTRYGEVRIYNKKIGLLSKVRTLSNNLENDGTCILTIVGRNDNIKIYLDRELVLDGTGLFIEPTSSKSLEIGSKFSNSFIVSYKYFYYTTEKDYYPKFNEEYSNLQFYKTIGFPLSEVVSLKYYFEDSIDSKIFGVNPQDENKGGSIYKMISGENQKMLTVNKTFSPINKIKISPDGNNTAFAHSQGVSIFDSYQLSDFTYSLSFDNTNNNLPDNNGWDLVQNIGKISVFFDSNGLNINTLFDGV